MVEITPRLPKMFAIILKSSLLIIEELSWLSNEIALILALPRDLIKPELESDEAELILLSLVLCKLPELLKLPDALTAKLPSEIIDPSVIEVLPAIIFPELLKFAEVTPMLVIAPKSPSFRKSPTKDRVSDFASDAIKLSEPLLRFLAEIFKSELERILFELVIAEFPVITRLPCEEIDPEFLRDSIKFKLSAPSE